MLRELLEAYAETLKMRAKTPPDNIKVAFWRPWLDTGKLALFCKSTVCGNGKHMLEEMFHRKLVVMVVLMDREITQRSVC